MSDLNLFEDSWFAEYWTDKATEECIDWWVSYYGLPDLYGDPHEYWVRFAMAIAGWNAATKRFTQEEIDCAVNILSDALNSYINRASMMSQKSYRYDFQGEAVRMETINSLMKSHDLLRSFLLKLIP